MKCEVCSGTGYRLLCSVVAEVVSASPIPCAGPHGLGCPDRANVRADAKRWVEWYRYLAARDLALESTDPNAYQAVLDESIVIRTWRGRFHDRQPVGSIVVGDREAQWLACCVRIAREQPSGHGVDQGALRGLVHLGERCGWDPAQAVPDPAGYRREAADSSARRLEARARALAQGMRP